MKNLETEKISENTKIILGLLSLKGIGPATVRQLRHTATSPALCIDQIANTSKRVAKALESHPNAWEQAQEFAEEQVTTASQEGVRILSFFDEAYPYLLASSKDDPCLIYVKGALSDTPNASIAVIGTRTPSQHAIATTKRITTDLVEAGQSIVSGLALGCDAIAHEAAISANGHTVAVMAHGLQTVSPAANKGLADRILSHGGALISQYPFGKKPSPYLFVQRDKTQAALARGVVMIESSVDGGSLHASRASIANARWLAVPVNADQESALNANTVLTDGTTSEKTELLKCKPEQLERSCIILEPQADYSLLLE